MGDSFVRQPNEYRDVFDLDSPMGDPQRKEKLERLFINFFIPLTTKALSCSGLLELGEHKQICLLLPVKNEIMKLYSECKDS